FQTYRPIIPARVCCTLVGAVRTHENGVYPSDRASWLQLVSEVLQLFFSTFLKGTTFNVNYIVFPLGMDPPGRNSFGHTYAVIHHIQDGLIYRSDNGGTTGSPHHHKKFPIFLQNGRGHGAEHSFSGL